MDRLEVIQQVTSCTRCELVDQCSAPVPFSGKAPAKIVVVGEAPGGEEDKQSRPFIGPAGQWLRKRLNKVGIDPDSLSYMNVVSCFPHGTPTQHHIQRCENNRQTQLDLIDPDWILLVGGVALSAWRPDLKVSQTHGRPLLLEGRVAFSCYHPSAAMRRIAYDRDLTSDLTTFKEMLNKGKNGWSSFISDHCVNKCDNWVSWYDQNFIGWCKKHLPSEGKDRLLTIDNEYRRLSGKDPLVVFKDDGTILCSDGLRFKSKCNCPLHPDRGHVANPI